MTADEYRTALQSILQAHAQPALDRLHAIKRSLPEQARQLMVGIHPGQSEEGFFAVMVHLDGPDLYVLNKAIAPHRSLFEVRCMDGQMQPNVPVFDPHEPAFSVNDVIVDTCMEWVESLWQRLGGVGLPAVVFGEEDYGTIESKSLLP
ncbi:DUF6389 family protein [Chelativorans salis]|uniref:DUF6389 family protein n=1 Tax=Chelativorans salis TaxID=2978478 RepID=A0ABT2LMG5_9HYPH|nr:DUF6389 family protein [Chelativorans sp. EGI FJ00035]MCT7375027.1 DUF6389 family protein [Chelativorans sp. EGI FJ00035]